MLIQKTKIMASGLITSWEIDGETVEAVSDFIFLAPKSLLMVTTAMIVKDACSLKKNYDKPRQHVKSRDITLPTKVCIVKSMAFPVVMYGCEIWTIKKAEHQKLMLLNSCWRRL